MKTFEFEIINEHGMHARPASLLIQTINQFESEVMLKKDGTAYNGKSMLNIMKMAAAKGDVISVEAEGSDEAACVDAIKALIDGNFGE